MISTQGIQRNQWMQDTEPAKTQKHNKMTIYYQGIQTHQIFSIYRPIYDIHVSWKHFRQNLEPNIRTILIQQYSWLTVYFI